MLYSKAFKTTLAGLSFIAVLVAVFWYGAKPKQNLVSTEILSSSPDYFITQIDVKTFNEDGELIESLSSKQAFHYVNESKTLLNLPSVERRSDSGSWSAKADKGVIHDGSNDILLTENAEATKKYLQSEDITLNADSVHYLDKDQSLTSSGNATLSSTQGETSASEIITYINTEEVVMTGSVRGKYETAN